MKYPSLVYLKKPKGKMSKEVSGDLKLDLFLCDKTLDIVSNLVERSCIEERQKIFAQLNDADSYRQISELNRISKEFSALYSAYEEAEKENSKNALYLSVCRSFLCFVKEAEKPVASKLGEGFNRYFKELDNENFGAFEEKTLSLYDRVGKLLKASVAVSEDGAKFGFDLTDSLTDVLTNAYSVFCSDEPKITASEDVFFNVSEELLKSDGELCRDLSDFCREYEDAVDKSICEYEGETGFYIDLHSLVLQMKNANLPTIVPSFSDEVSVIADNVYDFTLLKKGEKRIVPNDIRLSGDMKFCFLQGANGGGKTTYLRCVGANLLLALSGCSVCAERFTLCDFDGVFTHFPRDERFERGGRLFDEVSRINEIVNTKAEKKIVLLNETFSTTTEDISKEKTEKLASELSEKGFAGVYVTHCDISNETQIPIMSVLINPANENERTYKVAFNAMAASSFALDILKKYSLDEVSLRERFGEI